MDTGITSGSGGVGSQAEPDPGAEFPWGSGKILNEPGTSNGSGPPAGSSGQDLRPELEQFLSQAELQRLNWPEFWESLLNWYRGRLWVPFYLHEASLEGQWQAVNRSGLDRRLDRPFGHLPVVRLSLPMESKIVRGIVEAQLRAHCVRADTQLSLLRPLSGSGGGAVITPAQFFGLGRLGPGPDGAGVVIGMLDTGLDLAHPDLAHLSEENARDFTDDHSLRDWDGHGTHCVSVAVGRSGLAPGAGLRFGKVFSQDRLAPLEWMLAGLDWLVEQQVDVLSLSIGSAGDPRAGVLLTALCDALASKNGMIVVAAAGNSGPNAESIQPPADGRSVIAVGACDSARQLAPFSSRGSPQDGHLLSGKPDLLGPGDGVLGAKAMMSSYLATSGSGLSTVLSGTSTAAPALAALCAILASRCRVSDRCQRRSLVHSALIKSCTAMRHPDGRPYAGFETGAGIPDLGKALASLPGSGGTPGDGAALGAKVPPGSQLPGAGSAAGGPELAGAAGGIPAGAGGVEDGPPTAGGGLEPVPPAFRAGPGRTLRELEDEILGLWKLRVGERLARLAPALFRLKSGSKLSMKCEESNWRVSLIRDLAARMRWPRQVIAQLPAGREITFTVFHGNSLLGGVQIEFALDVNSLAQGMTDSGAGPVLARLTPKGSGCWFFGIGGVFGPRVAQPQERCCFAGWTLGGWNLVGGPDLLGLFHLESDMVSATEVAEYLDGARDNLVLAKEVAKNTGFSEAYLEFLAPLMTPWRWGQRDGKPYFTKT